MLVDDLRAVLDTDAWQGEGDYDVLSLEEARSMLEVLVAKHPVLPQPFADFFTPASPDGAVVIRFIHDEPVFAAWFERHRPGEVDWRFLVGSVDNHPEWCSGMAAEHLDIKRGFFRRLLYDAGIRFIIAHFPRRDGLYNGPLAPYRENIINSALQLGYEIDFETGIGILYMAERP